MQPQCNTTQSKARVLPPYSTLTLAELMSTNLLSLLLSCPLFAYPGDKILSIQSPSTYRAHGRQVYLSIIGGAVWVWWILAVNYKFPAVTVVATVSQCRFNVTVATFELLLFEELNQHLSSDSSVAFWRSSMSVRRARAPVFQVRFRVPREFRPGMQ